MAVPSTPFYLHHVKAQGSEQNAVGRLKGAEDSTPAHSSDVLATTQESTNASSDQAFERQYPQTGYLLVQGPSSYITAYFGSRVLRLSLPMILCKPNGAGSMTVACETLIQFQRHLPFAICGRS